MAHVSLSGLTRAEIVQAVRSRGLRVTASQVERWHKAGLLPAPRRRSLGRGHGTESRYHPIALAQAAAIAVYRRDIKSLDSIRWALWCFGFDVTSSVRAYLLGYLKHEVSRLRTALEEFEAETAADDIRTERLVRGRQRGAWGRIRRRVGPAYVQTVAHMLADLMLGQFDKRVPYDEPDDATAIRKLVDLFSPEPKTSDAETQHLTRAARLLGDAFNIPLIHRKLATVAERKLNLMRDEAQTFWRRIVVRYAPHQVRDMLVPPEAFLMWFALRHASPLTAPAMKRLLRQTDIPPLEPAPLIQLVRERHARAKETHRRKQGQPRQRARSNRRHK
jgi:hypothetical protein